MSYWVRPGVLNSPVGITPSKRDYIVRCVSDAMGVDHSKVMRRNRKGKFIRKLDYVKVRQVSTYIISKIFPQATTIQYGQVMGVKHCTAIYSINKVQDDATVDREYRELIEKTYKYVKDRI